MQNGTPILTGIKIYHSTDQIGTISVTRLILLSFTPFSNSNGIFQDSNHEVPIQPDPLPIILSDKPLSPPDKVISNSNLTTTNGYNVGNFDLIQHLSSIDVCLNHDNLSLNSPQDRRAPIEINDKQ